MRTETLRDLAMLAGALLYGCPPAPTPPPNPPDASDAAPSDVDAASSPDASPEPVDAGRPPTVCEQACAALAAAGCREGAGAWCPAVLTKMEADRFFRTPAGKALKCADVAAVKSSSDVFHLGLGCTP